MVAIVTSSPSCLALSLSRQSYFFSPVQVTRMDLPYVKGCLHFFTHYTLTLTSLWCLLPIKPLRPPLLRSKLIFVTLPPVEDYVVSDFFEVYDPINHSFKKI
jgi:hypothetical protein